MAEKKRKRRKKVNYGRLVMSLIVVFLLVTGGFQVKNIIDLHMEQAALEEENKQLTETKNDLTAELESVGDLDYIEEQARKQLRMIKPGEVLYIQDKNAGGSDTEEVEDTSSVQESEVDGSSEEATGEEADGR